MKFIDIPTEQTTAVTDAILAAVALASVILKTSVAKGCKLSKMPQLR